MTLLSDQPVRSTRRNADECPDVRWDDDATGWFTTGMPVVGDALTASVDLRDRCWKSARSSVAQQPVCRLNQTESPSTGASCASSSGRAVLAPIFREPDKVKFVGASSVEDFL